MLRKIGLPLMVAVMVSVLLFTGCTRTAAKTVQPGETETSGKIEDGVRVINITKGFSKTSMAVNRGEELAIRYTGEEAGVALSVPGYETEAVSETITVELYVKAKIEGDFEIVATDGKLVETGLLIVKPYENEAVFKSVGADAFEAAMTGDYFLLDVRTIEEYDEVHIDGATLISVYELESRLAEIAQYKDTPVLVYCRSGNRSIVASQVLVENGFMNVTDLNGGIFAWLKYLASK